MGSITINGSTSGSVTISAPAVAGTTTLTLPATTSNVLTSVTAVAAVTGTPSASNYLRGDGTWAAVSASGQLIRAPQILTSGTSYTTPSNCTAIYVELWGAGGGGGGNSSVSGITAAGGGGSGAFCAKYSTVTGNTAYTIAIGAAGTGASGSGGSSGGSTTITIGATTYTAGGGAGGAVASGSSASAGGAGGTATNGDVNLVGMYGSGGTTSATYGFVQFPLASGFNPSSTGAASGAGGCIIGPLFTLNGASGLRTNGTGATATFYSGGGAGGYSNGAGNQAGGSGTQGVIRIWEFT